MSEHTTPPEGEPSAETPEQAAPQTESASASPGEPGAGAASETAESAGIQALPLGALAGLPAADLLSTCLSLLAAKAWQGMGLVPNPLTGKTEKNLDDARLAIDAYAAVFELLRARLEEQPRREMENVLTMLRVNFVEKSAG